MDSANAFSSLHLNCIPVGKRPIKRIHRQMLQLQENKRTLLTKHHTHTTRAHTHAHRRFLKRKKKTGKGKAVALLT